jgi:hypothetical protein
MAPGHTTLPARLLLSPAECTCCAPSPSSPSPLRRHLASPPNDAVAVAVVFGMSEARKNPRAPLTAE